MSSHPVKAAAMEASPAAEVNAVHAMLAHVPFSSSPRPAGCNVKTKGTRNAGNVYFQAIIVVRYGFPPVIAAAANGARAVGGETSESTA